jgi:osmoprotectant transport system ATP-binding protein
MRESGSATVAQAEQDEAASRITDHVSPDPAIRFENVTKRFPSATNPAVDGVTLEVRRGDLVVLLGPSGCGKTTLLKMVNRLYEHDSGRVLIDGREIRSFAVNDLRRRIGYVIQSTGLFPHMTVARNVATVPEMLGWSRERIRERTDELLTLVGLSPDEYRGRYPAQLSGGQQQRVGLARALAADPALMLMDEPFAAIDNITRRRLQDELRDIQSRVRKTILFVTHDVDEALRLADRIAVMMAGKVVQYDTPLAILTNPANEFVASLVGSDDLLRRLSLLPIESAILPPPPGCSADGVCVEESATLRDALNILLRSDADTLPVVDADRQVVGVVSLEGIREKMRDARGEREMAEAAP